MKQIGVKNVKLSEYEMSIAAHLVDPLNMHVCIVNLIEDFFFSCILCQGSRRFDDSRRNHRIQCSDAHRYDLLQEDTRQNHKERGSGDESGGNQARAFRSRLPVKSHRMHLIPPATRYEKHVKCCPPGKLIRDFMPRF